MAEQNNQELISVIIPTRNRVNLLKQAVDSVLNQTYKNLELFIVDEASTDDTKAYLSSISDERVSCIYHETPQGGNTARNNGFLKADGRYIAFLDDDDIWANRKLDLQIKAFQEHPEVGLVSGNNIVINDKKDIVRKSDRGDNVKYENEKALEKIMLGNFIGGASFPLIKREVFEEVEGFQKNLKSAQETNLYLRIIEKGHSVYMCKEPLLLYRVHSQNRITDSYEPKLQGLDQLYHYKKEHFFPQLTDDVIDRVTYEHLKKISMVYMQHKKYSEFIDVKERIMRENLKKQEKNQYIKIRMAVLRNKLVRTYPGRMMKTTRQKMETKKLNKQWKQYIDNEFIAYR